VLVWLDVGCGVVFLRIGCCGRTRCRTKPGLWIGLLERLLLTRSYGGGEEARGRHAGSGRGCTSIGLRLLLGRMRRRRSRDWRLVALCGLDRPRTHRRKALAGRSSQYRRRPVSDRSGHCLWCRNGLWLDCVLCSGSGSVDLMRVLV
jgi:hypothetical protein